MFVVFLFAFGCASSVSAEAVYLKNGKVMTGRIVEMTPRIIVLQTGEGEEAVKTTIHRDEINRIVSDEEHARSLALIPHDLKEQMVFPGVGKAAALTPGDMDPRERIRQMIESNREVALHSGSLAEDTDQDLFDKPPVSSEEMRMRGTPEMIAARSQMILDRKKQYKALSQEKAEPEEKGEGRIAGTVILRGRPADWTLTGEAQGDLYVYLMKEMPGGVYVAPVPMPFARIPADRILSAEVVFEIPDVPSGTYRVYADWDVADPAVKVQGAEEGRTMLNYLGSKGDYAGSYPEKVVIEGAQTVKDLIISCTQPLILDQIFQDPNQVRHIVVTDIFFVRTASGKGEGRIVVLIKNAAAVPVAKEMLELVINEERQLFPIEFFNVGPGETQPYDITSFYRDYARRHYGDDGSEAPEPRSVRFRLGDPVNREMVFDKTIYIM